MQFNHKKVCGWQIIGSVIIASTIFGGSIYLNPFIFMIGYSIDFTMWDTVVDIIILFPYEGNECSLIDRIYIHIRKNKHT
ncbi:DUF6609 family protein [Paenibacillus provencensis]|uniref:DUF6609 family protein n=1 Tax=Paenibacillus provencensis TaxID=441151 RepID=A0ABW3PV54_9BACL